MILASFGENPEITKGSAPVFKRVSGRVAAVPRWTSPKERFRVEGLMEGATAVPLNGMVRVGLSGSFELKLKVPLLDPTDVGLKETWTVVDWPGLSVVNEGPKRRNPPLVEKELRLREAELGLLRFWIRIVVADVSPTGMVPKL